MHERARLNNGLPAVFDCPSESIDRVNHLARVRISDGRLNVIQFAANHLQKVDHFVRLFFCHFSYLYMLALGEPSGLILEKQFLRACVYGGFPERLVLNIYFDERLQVVDSDFGCFVIREFDYEHLLSFSCGK